MDTPEGWHACTVPTSKHVMNRACCSMKITGRGKVRGSIRYMTVLFVCVGNTCRSVLAEYLGRRFCGDRVSFESAGIRPQRAADADNAVHVLRQTFGIDAAGHQPRDVRGLDLSHFDVVIAVDPGVVAVVRALGVPEARLQVWPIRDPWGGDLTEYEDTALDIRKRLARWQRSVDHAR